MNFEISNIGIVTAVAAGAVSFLSPCVLPLVPGYVSFIAGRAGAATRHRAAVMLLSLAFVLGFSTVFVGLGASATVFSRLLRAYSYEAGIVGGAIIVAFGLVTAGLVRIPWMQNDLRYHGRIPSGGPLGAYLLGLAFAFGWTPCIGPILGAILTVSAVSATAADGIVLLSLYSLGLGVPFVLAALFTQTLMGSLPRMRRAGRYLQVGAGGIMIVMGVAMMTGQMTRFAFWLLETFPAFGSIG
ncbi:cytochrome c biogenesis protein CcdA [Pseudaminobacter sp. 19-2017]|uniref:Cytochrome c biogenesis protein CcdA n=1 Tax=Pseudaminobacter soli (ex Zhang et al. 2022) TaxID=2831468 RepID=A0A942E1Z9_9HYPH|nr:cytochrome c biogenesis protein CcdA [Pseudaminobacter soli]MBS3651961.1 cytochrome c biogenesis protein CcdA [Pseudaminobacter soli]